MSILYEDRYLVCDDEALTIKDYFFPKGSKRIPYADIRKVSELTMTALTGQWRIWGMGLSPYWYHYDALRPTKSRSICLDLGKIVKPILTPEHHDEVLLLLKEKRRGDA